jgi:hypothetical protein
MVERVVRFEAELRTPTEIIGHSMYAYRVGGK